MCGGGPRGSARSIGWPCGSSGAEGCAGSRSPLVAAATGPDQTVPDGPYGTVAHGAVPDQTGPDRTVSRPDRTGPPKTLNPNLDLFSKFCAPQQKNKHLILSPPHGFFKGLDATKKPSTLKYGSGTTFINIDDFSGKIRFSRS